MHERKHDSAASIAAFTDERLIHFSIDSQRQHAGYTWFRGDHCNFNPKQVNLRTAQDVASHILHDWLPPGTSDRIRDAHRRLWQLLCPTARGMGAR